MKTRAHQRIRDHETIEGDGLIQLLDTDGLVLGVPPMTREQTVEGLRLMLLSRAIDERLTKLQRMGKVGLYAPVHGQEAAVVGSAMALDPGRDWMVPASREQPAMLRHGLPLLNMFAGYLGRTEHAVIPAGVNLLPRQQAIGAQIPHAVGIAWALKLRGARGVVMVYFGEGASSEGDFHEACNLAGVLNVPLVLVLINNGYAISTPTAKQTAAKNLASRAAGYGIAGASVDGNDLFAVYHSAHRAAQSAAAGHGPTLIECRTYRVGFHNTSDNPKAYRDDAEVRAAIGKDPIERVRRFATGAGWWSSEMEAEALERIRAEIDAAQKSVESLPRPEPSSIFDHVYESLTPGLSRQRSQASRSGRADPTRR